MKHPDPYKHMLISFAKSAVRIIGSLMSLYAVVVGYSALAIVTLALAYGVAECIGIYEELV